MTNSYKISGTINAYPIKDKFFNDNKKALRYLDNLVTDLDLQIEKVIVNKLATTYVANDYSRFTVTKLA